MRPQWIMPSFLLLMVLAVALPATAQVAVVEPRHIDLGQMNQDEIRETVIHIANGGQGMLVINEVEADCGCTIAEIQKKQLGPGETTILNLTFESKKFFGLTRKALHLHTNDPQHPVIDIMIQVDIYTPLVVLPRGVRFPNTALGTERVQEVSFKAAEVPELVLKGQTTEKGYFKIDVVHGVDGDPQAAKVLVTLPEVIETGRLQDQVTISTNVPEEPYVDLMIQAIVGDVLVPYPTEIKFRFNKTFNRDLRIRPFTNGELPFNVTDLEIDVPGVAAEITGGKQNYEVVIKLSGRPIPKTDPRAVEAEGRISGTLTVHTDRQDVPIIKVPVSYLVRM